MIVLTLLLCFLLNVINHGNIIIAVLNTLLLFFSLCFYFRSNHQHLPISNFPYYVSPLIILVGAVPLFTRANNMFIICIALGASLLALFYITTKFKTLTLILTVGYLVVAGLYANGLIKPTFVFQTNLLIINDNWTNLYITQMRTESQYMPAIMRYLIYNPAINVYVMASKIAGLFTLKIFYDAFLVANIYPFVKGLISDLKVWNKSKTVLAFCSILILFSVVVSRSVDVTNTLLLLVPFLVYLILKGLNSVNKVIYLLLFAVSIVIATSP